MAALSGKALDHPMICITRWRLVGYGVEIAGNRGRRRSNASSQSSHVASGPEEYRVAEITRVSFGGDYEDALHLVGGGG